MTDGVAYHVASEADAESAAVEEPESALDLELTDSSRRVLLNMLHYVLMS